MSKETESRQVLLQNLKASGIDDEFLDEFISIIPKKGIQRINAYRFNCKQVNLAHYAALSGTVETLNWVRQNRPELLDKHDENQRSLAYYAMYSGSVDTLNWIKENKSELFDQVDKWGNTLAHSAARMGNITVLDWLKENRPDLLLKFDNDGNTIAHEAALSGEMVALDWVKQNAPELLDKLNTNGRSVTVSAVWSNKPEQLNFAIKLSMEPSKLTLSGWVRELDLACISKMLESNFSLTQFEMESTDLSDNMQILYGEIQEKIARNCIIRSVITEMKNHFNNLYYPTGRIHLPRVKQTFLNSLPQELTPPQKNALFQSTFIQASPINRAITLISEEINRMRINRATSNRVFTPASESILSELLQLKALFSSINATYETIQEKFNTWKESNKDRIDMKGFTLFKDSSTRELVDKIQTVFDDWTRAQKKDVSDENEPFTRPGFHIGNDDL